MDKLEQALDKTTRLGELLEKKLREFTGLLNGVLIGMSALALIQFVIILWLILN